MTDKVQKIREEVEKRLKGERFISSDKEYNYLLSFIDSLQEEPVNDDLKNAANIALEGLLDKYGIVGIGSCLKMFKLGAEWQKEQFEKNRLAACDKQTEEDAEIESDFVMGIIENEHRQPTFDDAIKYGMRLQKKEMMKDAGVLQHCTAFYQILSTSQLLCQVVG